jgi:hypothetical protein
MRANGRAKEALAEARRVDPKLTVKWMTHAESPGVFDGLRKASLPEE